VVVPLRQLGAATAVLLSATAVSPADPAQTCSEDAMIVFDGSGSMAEMGFNDIDEPRIFDARRAVARTIPEIARNRRIGLLVYGPGSQDGCSGIDLRFPPIEDAAPRILSAVNTLQPAGETPLTAAVAKAVRTLNDMSAGGTIVLLTDGKETCGGQPCQLAAQVADEGLTIHVIGFKVRGSYFSWESQSDYGQAETVSRCLADRTGGLYLNTETVEELIAAFRKTLGCNVLF
jgi:Ca-activated chloride channel family protein